jgi:hypothetical protein
MSKKDLIKRADGSYSQRGLWDNIRANAGSGKKPSKEMLAQEKKINNEMANGGQMSTFKASNIQTYAEGGEMEAASGGPGHPFKKWIERTNPTANLYASPYYTNSLVGNRIPGYRAGFSTATGAGQYAKPVGGFGGLYVGQQYDPHTPSNTFLSPTSQLDHLNFGKLNAAGNPEGPNIMFGGNIGWQGKAVKGGDGPAGIFPSAMPRLEALAEYAPSTGIGFGAKVGSVFPIQKGNYRQGQVKGGIHNASLMLEPYTGGTFNSTKGSGFGWGLKADAEYRPRFLDKLGIPGNGYLSANFASPIGAPDQGNNLNPDGTQSNVSTGSTSNPGIKWRPNFSIEGGYRMPLQKMDEIDLPKFSRNNMSDLIEQAEENEENNPLEQQPYIPNEEGNSAAWGKRGEVNASPIHKRWQPDANDIFIPPTQGGNEIIQYPPQEEEGTESFAVGGSMGGWPPDKMLRGASLYSNAFRTNTITGDLMPTANLGFEKSFGPKKSRWTIGGDVGLPYGNQQIGNFEQGSDLASNFTIDPENNVVPTAIGLSDNPLALGFHAKYDGITNSNKGKGYVELAADYNNKTGLGVGAIGGLKFGSNPRRRNDALRPGTAAGSITPYGGVGFGNKNNTGFIYGVQAEGEWKPKFLKKTPLSLYGKAQFQGAAGEGKSANESSGTQSWANNTSTQINPVNTDTMTFRPSASVEAGVRVPLKDLQQKMRGIDIGKLNLPPLDREPREGGDFEETEEHEYIPNEEGNSAAWGERQPVNASPIHKQWQPDANDIYLPPAGPTPGMSPMTYDPSIGEFENNTEEMNNYSKGGQVHINFANGGSFNNKGFRSLPPQVQAKIRSNSFADGGQLTEFNEGGTHEESPLGGIPQGMAPDGKMNLVEEGETKLNTADYIFSDQIKIDKETATLFGLSKGDVGKTFADVSKKVNRPNSRRDNDTIEQVAIQRDLESLMQAQEKQKEMQKDKDIAEFASKYPELAQNMPVPGQEQQMAQPQMGQAPMMDPNAMQQGMMQEQMNPPAGMPQQEIDPAMMAQMQQMGQMPMSYGGSLFNCGGKMYNNGGYMYDAGGHMYAVGGNVMRGIGAGAYGVGEGLLDTLTFGLTDTLTDKGFDKLAGMGGRSESEVEKDKMIRGFGNVGGAVLGAGLTGGAATSSAVNEGIEGLTSGVTNIKGTGEQFDKIAGGIGQGASTIAGFMGPQGATQAAGVFKGNEAVNKLMTAKQNPFINQATNFAANAFANGGRMNYSMYQPLDHITQYGGPLNMPTNDNPYANFLAMGGGMEGEDPINPTLAFNLNGIVANYTLEQAINDPLVLEAFGASADEKGQFSPEDVEAAKLAIEQKFIEESPANRKAAFLAQQEYDAALSEDAAGSSMDRLPGETDAAYQQRVNPMQAMSAQQGAKPGVGEIKQTPLEGAMMALPAAYNIGRGIFGKPNLLNYEDYAQKANIDPYTMNIDPQLAEVRRAYAGANQAIKNASPGSGAYLTNMANVAASKQEATNALYTKKEMFDKDAAYKADLANRDIDKSNLDLEMKLQTYNDAAKAAKAKSLQEGLGQLADIAKNEQGISLQEALFKLMSPDYAEKFNYSSLFEQAQKAAKSKKGTKAGK